MEPVVVWDVLHCCEEQEVGVSPLCSVAELCLELFVWVPVVSLELCVPSRAGL